MEDERKDWRPLYTAEELAHERDLDRLLNGRERPKGWAWLSHIERLDWIATRIIAEDRGGVTSHNEIRESGILSVSQYERRRNREVYSEIGDLDAIRPNEGIFSRVHVRDLRGRRARVTTEDDE